MTKAITLPAEFQFSICGKVFCCAFIAFAFLITGSAKAQDKGVEISGTTMGPILYSVIITDLEGAKAKELGEEIQATLDQVNDSMSTYKSDSDVSLFNASQSTEWFSVDAKTANVVARAIEISEMTEGAFDISVAPAVNLWSFGPDKKKVKLPNDEQVERLRKIVGYQHLAARVDPPALKKSVSELQIDLSAIAKGYAVDEVVRLLRSKGFSNFMVEVGGEVYAVGESPQGRAWRIGIEKPVRNNRKIDSVVEVNKIAVATSGDYRNFRVVDGKRYSHTIDPATCRPVLHSLATASVTAQDCMTADAVATAIMVMGREKGMAFAESEGFQLYLIERDQAEPEDADLYKRIATDGYPVAGQNANGAFTPSKSEPAEESSDIAANPKQSTGIFPVFLAALIVFLIAILGMAVGSIAGNRSIQGSCGGLANMPGGDGCSMCDDPSSECKENEAS